MTISQSRYGGVAEMGRNPTHKPARDSRTLYGIPAGAATAGAGALALRRSKTMMVGPDRSLRTAEAALGAAEHKWNGGYPQTQVAGQRGFATRAEADQLKRAMGAAGGRRDIARTAFDAAKGKSGRLKRGGRAALVTGSALAGISALKTELERGTHGKRRSLSQVRPALSAGDSARMASARRVNGL